jgi:hypothetical protein
VKRHTITLLDGPGGALRVPADVLVELVSAVQEGALRAACFMVDGESVRKGPKPSWLDAVGQLEITGLTQGSAVLQIEAPSLAEAVPDRFGPSVQIALFAEPARTVDTTQSAVDFFGSVLVSALRGDREALLADRALLDACARFARVPGRAFRSVRVDGIADSPEPLVLSAADAEKIELLRDETPSPRAARVTGTLDTISATRTDVVLRLTDGTAVGARVERHDPEALRGLFAKRVVVAGMAQFRPSGRLLVIDAEHIGPATEGDSIWEQPPSPRPGRSAPVARLLPQDDRSGVAAFFGTWPGDESDEELLAALAAIR